MISKTRRFPAFAPLIGICAIGLFLPAVLGCKDDGKAKPPMPGVSPTPNESVDIIRTKLGACDSTKARGIEGPVDLEVYILDTEQVKNPRRSKVFNVLGHKYVTVSLCDTVLRKTVDFALEFDQNRYPEIESWDEGVCRTLFVRLQKIKRKSDGVCGCSAELVKFLD